jgi:small GTP-binding protein
MSDDNILKFVILGEGRVGKTSILQSHFKKKFNEGEKSTINPAFYQDKVNYKGKVIQLKFWDTAGQEQFNAISTMYYQNAVGALLVYDTSIFETFEKVKQWVITLQEAVGKDIIFVIAGNKMDLIDKNIMEQQKAEIDSYCAKEKCKHFYTSAKTGFQLDEVFETLINSVLNKVNSSSGGGTIGKRKGKKLEISEQKVKKEKKGCC